MNKKLLSWSFQMRILLFLLRKRSNYVIQIVEETILYAPQ